VPHPWHIEPFEPHVVLLLVLQRLSAVQQPGHPEEGSHTHALPLHRWPCSQRVHARPPPPHDCALGVVMQMLPLQQPLEHEVGLQTQAPPLHAWPESHFSHAFPPVPQALTVPDSMQCWSASQHPSGQVLALQTH
jgi:hypothetical protein